MMSFLSSSLLVALGGALGALLRYWAGRGAAACLGVSWPWGTFLVNILGGVAIGAVVMLATRELLTPAARLFLTTGLLGGFTTFSAFSLEVVDMIQRDAWAAAAMYIFLSVALSVAGVLAGIRMCA